LPYDITTKAYPQVLALFFAQDKKLLKQLDKKAFTKSSRQFMISYNLQAVTLKKMVIALCHMYIYTEVKAEASTVYTK